MRALIVTNMWPTSADQALGSFVYDQVEALRSLGGLDVEVFSFADVGGGPRRYLRAARELRRRHGGDRFDVVHAHFGLSAYPALALRGVPHVLTLHGTDVRHPVSGRLTRLILGRYDLVATVSSELAALLPARRLRRPVAILPCGVALDRFVRIARADARRELGLDPDGRYVLLSADPSRPAKRHDRAGEVADGLAQLLTLGGVAPAQVPLYVNAANAVLAPSDAEGFGLAVLEALACDVPVLATPVGVHAEALDGVAGTLCAPYDRDLWRSALHPHVEAADPRIDGRARAARWSATEMAQRVADAWSELV